MQITRHHHLRHMVKVTPGLILLYIFQMILYQKFAPRDLASEVNLFVGLGLALVVIAFHLYDNHHKVIFKRNFLEVRFDALRIKEEILYKNMAFIEVKKKGEFGQIVIHQRNGKRSTLHHIDSPELVKTKLENLRDGTY